MNPQLLALLYGQTPPPIDVPLFLVDPELQYITTQDQRIVPYERAPLPNFQMRPEQSAQQPRPDLGLLRLQGTTTTGTAADQASTLPGPYAVPRADLSQVDGEGILQPVAEMPTPVQAAPANAAPPGVRMGGALSLQRSMVGGGDAVDYLPDDLDPYLVSSITNAGRFMPSEQASLGAARGLLQLRQQNLQDAQFAANQQNQLAFRRAQEAARLRASQGVNPRVMQARMRNEAKMVNAIPDIVNAASVAERALRVMRLAKEAQDATPASIPNVGDLLNRVGAGIAYYTTAFGEDAERIQRLNTMMKSLRLEGAPALEKLRPVSNYEAKIGVPMPETIGGGLTETVQSAKEYATEALRAISASFNNLRRIAPGAYNEMLQTNPELIQKIERMRRDVAMARALDDVRNGERALSDITEESLKKGQEELVSSALFQPVEDPQYSELPQQQVVQQEPMRYYPRDDYRAAGATRFMNQWGDVVLDVSQQTGIPPEVIVAVVDVESDFNPDAISREGAYGFMQLMPETAKGLGVDREDPRQNILGGARYLRQIYDKFGRWDLTFAGYNAGPKRKSLAQGRIPNNPETKAYVDRLLKTLGLQYGQ